MKKIITALFLLICLQAIAQEATSKLEQAIQTRGSLFKEEIFSLENITAFRMDAVRITNLEKFDVVNGIKVLYKRPAGKEIQSLYNYIDEDEIEGLTTSLQYMSTLLKSKATPAAYTEIQYITRSGFRILLYTIVNDKNQLDWAFAVQPDTRNNSSQISLGITDIEALKKTLTQAKSKF